MGANDETPSAIFLPTPAAVLRWIAASGDVAWFPAQYAREHAVPRDALDDPLAVLRTADLVRVRDWVKGLGQGYTVTPEGAKFVDDPQKLLRFLAEPKREIATVTAPTTFDRGEEARQALLEPKPPVAVPALIVANVFWFFVGLVIAVNAGRSGNAYLTAGDAGLLERLGAISGFDLLRGQWWRLLTCAFVHNGILHLLLNMYALASVGSVTESIWGVRRFIKLYAASAIGASCLAMAVHPGSIGAGASGAFWGLMCSLIAWLVLNRRHLPAWMVKKGLQQIGILFAISFVVSFAPGVGWAAHFGGGIVGFLVGSLFVLAGRAPRTGYWLSPILAALLVAACVGGLALQSTRSHGWKQVRLVEYFRQRTAFVKAVEPAMKPIQPGPVDLLYRQAMDVVHLGAKKPDLPARIEKLRDDAIAFAAIVDRQPRPAHPHVDFPAKYRNYANAVRDLADAILEQLKNPAADLSKVKECKRTVDELRAEFNRPEKFEL